MHLHYYGEGKGRNKQSRSSQSNRKVSPTVEECHEHLLEDDISLESQETVATAFDTDTFKSYLEDHYETQDLDLEAS